MSLQLKRQAAAWLAAGRPTMLVQVLHSKGSVPREAGTRMLVAAHAVLGTIGGGHLELQAIAHARDQLASSGVAHHGAPPEGANGATQDRHYALGPALGQCCGGALTLRTTPLDATALAAWPDAPPLFTLQLYGAGHVGRAIVHLLNTLHCHVSWIDERESEFPAVPASAASAPQAGAAIIDRLCVEPVEAEVRNAPPGAFYLVLTHSHALDLTITTAILQRGDFGYLGLIGSATKRARFMHRFEQRGLPTEAMARLTCPIGVPGMPGKQPEVIALAVVAQLLQVAAARPCPMVPDRAATTGA